MIPLSILLRQEVDLSIMCDSIKDLRQEVDPDNSSKSIMNPSCHFAFARSQDATHFFIITYSVLFVSLKSCVLLSCECKTSQKVGRYIDR